MATISSKMGVVVLLDVLGFKDKTNGPDRKKVFSDFLEVVEDKSKVFGAKNTGSVYDLIRSDNTDFVLYSDTLVYYQTETEGYLPCDLLVGGAAFVNNSMSHLLELGMVVRGAMSYGEVMISDKPQAICGPAINEAASEYEATEWVGCHLTDSADSVLKTAPSHKQDRVDTYFQPCDIPFKKVPKNRFSVAWLRCLANHAIEHHKYYYDGELKDRILAAGDGPHAIRALLGSSCD